MFKNTAPILWSEMIGNIDLQTKMFDFEERLLIGWLANTVREPAIQDAYLKVHHFCFYVKVVYHFRPEYNSITFVVINLWMSIRVNHVKLLLQWKYNQYALCIFKNKYSQIHDFQVYYYCVTVRQHTWKDSPILTVFQTSAVPTPNHARVTLLHVTTMWLSQNSAITLQCVCIIINKNLTSK